MEATLPGGPRDGHLVPVLTAPGTGRPPDTYELLIAPALRPADFHPDADPDGPVRPGRGVYELDPESGGPYWRYLWRGEEPPAG